MSTFRTIDLFAGAGGLSWGFQMADAGFDPVLAVEHDMSAAATYAANLACEVHSQGIEDVPAADYPAADVVIGGPPCQGFSPLGRDRDPTSRAILNSLWEHFLAVVTAVRPRAFVIENVPEFQRSRQFNELLHRMATQPRLKSYGFGYGVLNAADYGVPQQRRRGIFMAVNRAEVPWPPPPTHSSDCSTGRGFSTVREAIGDLPAETIGLDPMFGDDGRQHLHFGRNPWPTSIERYRAIPPGGNRFDLQRERPDLTPACWRNKPTGTTDVMGRLWWDRPSVTIRTEFFKPEKGRYLHPEADRPITHREAARLQSFPDDFVFHGSKIEIARQIGNAVPPRLGAAVATHLASVLQTSKVSVAS